MYSYQFVCLIIFCFHHCLTVTRLRPHQRATVSTADKQNKIVTGIGSINSSRTVRQDRVAGQVEIMKQVYGEKTDPRSIQEVYHRSGLRSGPIITRQVITIAKRQYTALGLI